MGRLVSILLAVGSAGAVVLTIRTHRRSRHKNSGCHEHVTSLSQLLEVTQDGLHVRGLAGVVRTVSVTNQGASLAYWPPALSQFSRLSSVNLSGNSLTYVSPGVGELVQLQSLDLSRNTLTSLPAEIGKLPRLESLDVGRNQLVQLPEQLCDLTSLTALNVMNNQLVQLPASFGRLSRLVRLGLKSNRLQQLPDSFSQLGSLVELFITDNKLTLLPPGFGSLTSLVKLQASFNDFTDLPPSLFQLPNLEMCRLAVTSVAAWPQGLLESGALPRLAWASLGAAPAAAPLPKAPEGLVRLRLQQQLQLGRKLGDGASGDVFLAEHGGEPVAVKLFRSDVGPDGRTLEELAISAALLSLGHPHLTRVRGVVAADSGGDGGDGGDSGGGDGGGGGGEHAAQGLVLDLVTGLPLAEKPTSQHLLRCKYQPGQVYEATRLLSIAAGTASALAHLHSNSVCHGDVYAHNLLVDDSGHPVLCDFGAAFCYDSSERFWEAMEVRAFGLLLHDLVERLAPGTDPALAEQVRQLVGSCVGAPASSRPTFTQLHSQLWSLQQQLGLASAAGT